MCQRIYTPLSLIPPHLSLSLSLSLSLFLSLFPCHPSLSLSPVVIPLSLFLSVWRTLSLAAHLLFILIHVVGSYLLHKGVGVV